jgi:signal transduction histidine kinase
MFLLAGWGAVASVKLTVETLPAQLFLHRLLYVFVPFVPVAWFAFTVSFTDRFRLTPRWWAALAVVPIGVVLAAWSSPASGLLWADVHVAASDGLHFLEFERGALYPVHLWYSYLLLAAGTVIVGRVAVTTTATHRRQSIVIVACLAVPWVANASYFLDVFPPRFDPTPLSFAVSSAVLAAAVGRYDMFDALPIAREAARDRVFEHMADAVVVVSGDRIVDLNASATAVLSMRRDAAMGRSLADVAPSVAAQLSDTQCDARIEYAPEGDDGPVYDVRTSGFVSPTGRVRGRILTFRDVTRHRRHEQRLSVLNRVLRHDIRNDLNVISGYAGLLVDDHVSAPEKRRAAATVESRVSEMLALTENIRSVERALDSDEQPTERVDVVSLLEELAASARQAYPEATIDVDAPASATALANSLVDSVFDNLVENALEHAGSDQRIEIAVSVGEDVVETSVRDDGPGIPDAELAAVTADGETDLRHASGFGLWLVRWLVRQSDGSLTFDVDDGTTVTVSLPRAT